MTCTVPKSLRRKYLANDGDVELTTAAQVAHPRAAFWCHTGRRGWNSIVWCYLCGHVVCAWNGGSALSPVAAARIAQHRGLHLAARALARQPKHPAV